MLSPVDLGWLAGIVDGEASIHVQLANRLSGTGGNLYFEMRIETTSFAMAERISLNLETAGIQHKVRPKGRRHNSTRDIYLVAVYRREHLESLLRLLLPILVVKAEEAKAVLEWYKRWPKGKHGTANSLIERESVVARIKSLKRVA